mmetsp:Transcript_14287/g.18720  ORF Transcript_14287/g.18720 Transcript_14287/m.18720 type:complete len:89 (+) Transcript_14287:83-349(+)
MNMRTNINVHRKCCFPPYMYIFRESICEHGELVIMKVMWIVMMNTVLNLKLKLVLVVEENYQTLLLSKLLLVHPVMMLGKPALHRFPQ